MKKNYGETTTKLRMVLAQKGVSQIQLSEMSGVETYQISQLCSGKKTNIMLDTAKKICTSLNVTLDEAFGD